jgi:tripartite-type tricarboxylate transporter receptor subunit TctC
MIVSRLLAAATLPAMLASASGHADAQPYPGRALRLVVPHAVGSAPDFVGRTIAGRLGELLGQPVTVENRPGKNEIVGTEVAARAPPDGYTLLLVTPAFSANPALHSKLPYDTARAFVPVALLAVLPRVLVASTNLPVSSLQDVIAIAKASPGRIAYASTGRGSGPHLAGELLKSRTTVQMRHVVYDALEPALADLVAGRVQLMLIDFPAVEPLVSAGKLRALAVTGPKRLPAAPDVPTMTEAGVPDYELVDWFGVVVPAGSPKAAVERLNADLRRTMQSPEVRDKLRARLGAEAAVGTPADFAALLRSEFALWDKLAREMTIRVE